jgi:hypothetical protein
MKNLSVSFAVIVLIVLTTFAVSITPPPTHSDVAGVWVGTAKERRFIRVDLDTNGTGDVCISFPHDAAPYLYRVESWRLTDFTVQLRAQPIGSEVPRVTFGAFRYSRGALTAEIDKRSLDRTAAPLSSSRVPSFGNAFRSSRVAGVITAGRPLLSVVVC